MPNYYNPYNFFPQTYPGISSMQMQNAYTPQVPQVPQQPKPMEWVEGEVGAKAFQMPMSWPVNQPIPLWDSTDTVIYLKSWNQMGMPNPLQKLRYEMPEANPTPLLQSGSASADYVTKDDLKSLREEIQSLRDSMTYRKNQNGSNNQSGQNKGGNP